MLHKYVCNHIGYLPGRNVSCWQFPLEYLTAFAATRLSVHHVCKVKVYYNEEVVSSSFGHESSYMYRLGCFGLRSFIGVPVFPLAAI